MTEHTPGPWTATETGDVCVQDDPRVMIAWVTSPDSYSAGDQAQMANAHLIAAAPDMLAACKDCMENRGDWMALMTAAIAKATGG